MKHKLTISGWVVPLALLAMVHLPGCSDSSVDSSAQDDADKSVVSTAPAEEKALAKVPAQNNGTVKSNQKAGGYSYLEVDIGGEVFWLATAISSAQPGDKIAWKDHAMMANFTSKALGRTFKQILFVARVIPESELASRAHSGTVINSMTSAGYSYIQVEENGAQVWLAAPETPIEPGQSIRWDGGAPMRNFTSQSLNRSFDEIFFVSAIHLP
ncbi:MAG: hypothetical protein DRQ59_12340 [Gammaproteobacteria bacterium]|nr:MAG: hypothetical protein DRQ59_12340 [Gammaproteobacteria bacterium]